MNNIKKGKDLIFISRITHDGYGIEMIRDKDMSYLDNTDFNINPLSVTDQTYIASGNSTYVVKMRFNENYHRIKFTLDDFYKTMRVIIDEARDWWHRRCSLKENERLLSKYNLSIYDQSDEHIIKMYLEEHPDRFTTA